MYMPGSGAFTPCEEISAELAAQQRLPRIRAGFLAGTRVETARGWRPVETLVVGDLVQTFDGDLKQVIDTHHAIIRKQDAPQLIEVPGGMLNTCSTLRMMPGQKILLRGADVESLTGLPHALIPVDLMVGHGGIRRISAAQDLRRITLKFEEEELIFANTGALLHCAGPDRKGSHFRSLGARAAIDLFTTLVQDRRVAA